MAAAAGLSRARKRKLQIVLEQHGRLVSRFVPPLSPPSTLALLHTLLTTHTHQQQLLLSHTLTALLSAPLLTLLTILLGAPLTSHLPHTFLLSLHIALLTTPPLFYTRGVDGNAWRQILSVTAPWDETLGAAVGACVGAWLGAIPIPLDWDRVWQRWPVTPLVGAVGGWAAGRLVVGGAIVLGWGRGGVS